MAYTIFETTKGNDSGSDYSDDGKLTINAKRSWTIAFDAEAGSSTAVKELLQNAGDLPYESASHPDNAMLICRSVTVTRVSPIYYTASASYKSRPLKSTDQGATAPWETLARVSYRSVSGEAEVDEDYNGDPIVNPGTNEPVFGITRRISDIVAVIKRPFIVFSGPVIRQFMDQTNTDTYLSFSAGEGIVQSIQADESEFDGTTYFDVSAEILFRTPYRTTSEKAWYHRRMLKGYYEILTPSGTQKKERAVDDGGGQMTQPILLDESGQKIPDGGIPVFVDTKLYGSIAFSGMGFFT